MKLTLARPRPLSPLRYFRESYRLELAVREAEARARLAEAQQQLRVNSLLRSGAAMAHAQTAAVP